MIIETRFGEIFVEPSAKWEPIYRVIEKDGMVVDFAYFCPHCCLEFKSRRSCRMHCAGKQGMFTATCPSLAIHQCSANCKLYRHPGRRYVGGPKLDEEKEM